MTEIERTEKDKNTKKHRDRLRENYVSSVVNQVHANLLT